MRDGGTFHIEVVGTEGAVADWNARAPPGRELVVGSQILVVNGIRGEAERMLGEFKKVGPIQLVVRRAKKTPMKGSARQFATGAT